VWLRLLLLQDFGEDFQVAMFLGETQDCPVGIATPLSDLKLLQEDQHALSGVWAAGELAMYADARGMWSCLAAQGFDNPSEVRAAHQYLRS
jgi:hypothetical protein